MTDFTEYNKRISQVPGVFGDFVATDFLASEDNPSGAPTIKSNVDPYTFERSEESPFETPHEDESSPKGEESRGADTTEVFEHSEFGDDLGPAHAGVTADAIDNATATVEVAGFTRALETEETTEVVDTENTENTDSSTSTEESEEDSTENARKAGDIVADIKKAKTVEEVDELADGDDRSTVVNAAKARRKSLES